MSVTFFALIIPLNAHLCPLAPNKIVKQVVEEKFIYTLNLRINSLRWSSFEKVIWEGLEGVRRLIEGVKMMAVMANASTKYTQAGRGADNEEKDLARATTLSFFSDRELKCLVNQYGFAGAAREINRKYSISVTKQTVRNECKRRGLKVSAHDIKDGLNFEFLIISAYRYLGLENIQHIGDKIGEGVDVYGEYNQDVWTECRNWNLSRKIDKKMARERIIERFKGKEGIKLLVHAKKVEFTKNALVLIENNGIQYIGLGNEKLTKKNWDRMLQKAILKIGMALKMPMHTVLLALRKAKQEEKDFEKYWDLVEVLVDKGHITICNIDKDFDEIDETEDDGGGYNHLGFVLGIKEMKEFLNYKINNILRIIKIKGDDIMGKKIVVSFRVEKDLWEKFGEKVRKHGSNRSRIIRTMIRELVGEKVDSEWLFVSEGG